MERLEAEVIPSLTEAALFTLLQREWKRSKLPLLYAKFAQGYLHHYESGEEEDLSIAIDSETRNAERALLNAARSWPKVLADKWMMFCENFIKEVRQFAREVARCHDYNDHESDFGIEHDLSVQQIKYCIDRIHIKLSNTIRLVDIKSTLLKVLEDSKLRLRICPIFLKNQKLQLSEIKDIHARIKIRFSKTLPKRSFFDKLFEFLEYVLGKDNSDCDWQFLCSWRSSDSDKRLEHCLPISYLLATRNFEAAGVCHDFVKKQEDEQSLLMEAAQFIVLLRGCYDVETLIFIHKRMNKKTWIELLKREGRAVFRCLISSWQHRHLCIGFYKEMVEYCGDVNFLDWIRPYVIPESGVPSRKQRYKKHHFRDIIAVVIEMWKIASDKVKQQKYAWSYFIPNLIAVHVDFGIMRLLVDSYPEMLRKFTIANVVFELLGRGLDEHFPECFKIAGVIEKDIFTEHYLQSHMQNFICCKSKTNQIYANAKNRIELRLRLVIKDAKHKAQLQDKLLKDKDFVVQLIENYLIKEKRHCDHVLLWLHDFNKKKCKDFVTETVASENFLQTYVNFFMSGEGNIQGLIKIIHEGKTVHILIEKHRDVLYEWLSQLAKDRDFKRAHRLRNEFINLFESNEVPERLLFDFLQSPAGRKCVVEFLHNIKSTEPPPSFHGSVDDVMERIRAFVYFLVVTEDAKQDLERWLDTSYRHPNLDLDTPIKVDGELYDLDKHELESARGVVSAYYRLFRVILHDDLVLFLPNPNTDDIRFYSLRVIAQNGPEILDIQ